MGQVSVKLRSIVEGVCFWCPGCQEVHCVRTGGKNPWQWNGNLDQPTFSPSILVTSGHFIVGLSEPVTCWCTYNREHPDNPAPFKCGRCHSYVQNGRIQFLNDSTHALAGQTVDLPDLPPHLQDEEPPEPPA